MSIEKTLIMIMGTSGSGKSTLETKIVQHSVIPARKVVSVTTRDKREGEVNGEDYHFISDSLFQELIDNNDMIQKTEFAGNKYGSAVFEYSGFEEEFITIVITPKSAVEFISHLKEVLPNVTPFIVYFDLTDERITKQLRNRGDSEENIKERLSKDNLREQYNNSGLIADVIIKDNDMDPCCLMKVLNKVTSKGF